MVMGVIKINVVGDSIKLETALDPAVACLVCMKVAISLMEKLVGKDQDLIRVVGGIGG